MQQELAEAKKSAETFESLYKSSLVDNQSAKQKVQCVYTCIGVMNCL